MTHLIRLEPDNKTALAKMTVNNLRPPKAYNEIDIIYDQRAESVCR
jgi:hypothetical protein